MGYRAIAKRSANDLIKVLQNNPKPIKAIIWGLSATGTSATRTFCN
jgi:hypothetical protein